MYSHEPSKRANEDAAIEPRGTPGKSTLTGGMTGGLGGPAAPILQHGPSGDQTPSGDVSFLDSLIGGGAQARSSSAAPHPDVPDGEWVPWKGPYTESDRPRLTRWLMDRLKDNNAVIGAFLGDFVEASISITARYALDVVRSEKDSELEKFLKFAVAEGLAAATRAGVSMVANPAVAVVASMAVDYLTGRVLEAEDGFEKEGDAQTVIAKLSAASGAFVEAAVNELGARESDLVVWLSGAAPEEFSRFRIPPRAQAPDRELVRGAVAGAVAGAHHRNRHWCPCGTPGDVIEGEADEVTTVDNHVLLIDVLAPGGEAHVNKARFRTDSDTLADEIVNQVGLASLDTMAMHVTITGDSDATATARLLTALRAPFPVEDDDALRFGVAYPNGEGPLVFTRMPDGAFDVRGGTLGERLVLYQWAEGDHDLSALAQEINGTVEDEETQASRPGYHSAEWLARKVRQRVRGASHDGARKMARSRMFAVQVPTRA